jgi:transcriptional regulator with XRE-family HTH domain
MPKEKFNRHLPPSFASFGKDLKEARNILGLTRPKLAEMVHMDDRYLANIENSGYIPSLPLFHDLATAVNIPVETSNHRLTS